MKQRITNILNESLQMYEKYGSRSTKKLNVLHGGIADIAKDKAINLNKNIDLQIISKNAQGTGKEVKCTDTATPRNIDISVINETSDTEFVIEVKFPISNIFQNLNNMLFDIIGQTMLMNTSSKPRHSSCIMFIPINPFYYDKDGNIKKQEQLDMKKITNMYANVLDKRPCDAPDLLSINFFEFSDDHTKITLIDDSSFINNNSERLIVNNFTKTMKVLGRDIATLTTEQIKKKRKDDLLSTINKI